MRMQRSPLATSLLATLMVLASCGGGGGDGENGTIIMPPGNGAPVVTRTMVPPGQVIVVTLGPGGSGPSSRWIIEQGLDAYFSDADGDPLTYSAQSSHPGVAETGILELLDGEYRVYVQGVRSGTATITVVARDPEGRSVSQTFTARVTGETSTEPPDDHGNTPSAATPLALGGSRSGRIENGGDVDYFSFTLREPGTVSVYTTGSLDTVGQLYDGNGMLVGENDDGDGADELNFSIEDNIGPGTYYVRVGGYGSGTGSYEVHAEYRRDTSPSNHPPRIVRQFESQHEAGRFGEPWTLTYRSPETLGSYFTDPDGDVLFYSVSSDNPLFPMAVLGFGDDAYLFMVASGNGREGDQTATITVTARDPSEATATQTFTLQMGFGEPPPTVNRHPVAASHSTQTLNVGHTLTYTRTQVEGVFSDPDGDRLTYRASSSNSSVASVSTPGGGLEITARAAGTATISVIATDPGGLSATWQVTITVPYQGAPEIVFETDDRCNDGLDVEMRFAYAQGRQFLRWATDILIAKGSDTVTTVNCNYSNVSHVCYGARVTQPNGSIWYWGHDIDRSKGCETCCIPCPDSGQGKYSLPFNCPRW